jgi:hypothetical protein
MGNGPLRIDPSVVHPAIPMRVLGSGVEIRLSIIVCETELELSRKGRTHMLPFRSAF